MKVRFYCNLHKGVNSSRVYAYTYDTPASLTPNYDRYTFDVDFPPGTFVDETPCPTTQAVLIKEEP